jgi:signal transduction histidine kinase
MVSRVSPPAGTQASASATASPTQVLASPFGVYVCGSPGGAVSACNPAMAALWGRAPASCESHERSWSGCRLYRRDGTPLAWSDTPMVRGLRDGVGCAAEIVVERPDGSRFAGLVETSPLHDADGRLVGTVNVLAPETPSESETGEPVRDSVRTLEVLYRLVDRVARARTAKEVCDAGVQGILSVARADRASVLVFDEGGVIRFVSWLGLSEAYRAATEGHSPWTPETKDPYPLLVEDVAATGDLGSLRDVVLREGIRSLGFFPLVHQGRVLGKFMLYYNTPHVFTPDELRLASSAARHVILGLTRVASEEAIERFLYREQSARREAEAARAEAVRANRDKDEFLAMLAHELRNPVGVIVNAASLIDAAPDAGTASSRAGGMIRRQARHLGRLLDDLLDVARITSGRIQMERDLVDLRSMVDLAVESQRYQIEAKRQRIGMDDRAGGLTVLGDPVRLQQVVGNLVNNASKYSRSEGSIRLGLDLEGFEAILRVSDDGAGIPPDKLDSIFELFAQANPGLARTEGGLGIGLTLVRRIVELHGGTVRAHSGGLGRGAEFTVRLPVVAHATTTKPAATKPPPAARPRTTSRRILVVEDHADGRESLATSLALHGHEVVAAATGREGVEAAVSFAPDVVLLDIGLPDIDGYEVARRLRDRLERRTRLVALTGYGQPDDRARAKEAGFDAHLVKPVEPAKLLQVLDSLTEAPVG